MIANQFQPQRRIGSGSFGEVYSGLSATGEKVAIKFEKHGLRCPQLRHEYKVSARRAPRRPHTHPPPPRSTASSPGSPGSAGSTTTARTGTATSW